MAPELIWRAAHARKRMWKTRIRGSSVVGIAAFGPAESRLIMAFIQAIGFETDKRDEILALMGLWSADAIGNGTAQRGTMLEDRANPGRFVMSVWFESAEAAEENSGRPETSAFAEQFASLCTTAPEFQEFDVVDRYHP